jgi:hypothetical protein
VQLFVIVLVAFSVGGLLSFAVWNAIGVEEAKHRVRGVRRECCEDPFDDSEIEGNIIALNDSIEILENTTGDLEGNIVALNDSIETLANTTDELKKANIIRISKTTQLDVPAWAWTPFTVIEDWDTITFTSGTPEITVNLTTGKFTVTKRGLYLFDLFMAYTPAFPSPTHRVLILLTVNGLNVFENTIIATGEGWFGNNMDWATTVILEDGDVAQYKLTHDEGGKTDVINSGGGGKTNLMITRLGCL